MALGSGLARQSCKFHMDLWWKLQLWHQVKNAETPHCLLVLFNSQLAHFPATQPFLYLLLLISPIHMALGSAICQAGIRLVIIPEGYSVSTYFTYLESIRSTSNSLKNCKGVSALNFCQRQWQPKVYSTAQSMARLFTITMPPCKMLYTLI